jgi:hypothetical protein
LDRSLEVSEESAVDIIAEYHESLEELGSANYFDEVKTADFSNFLSQQEDWLENLKDNLSARWQFVDVARGFVLKAFFRKDWSV